MSPCLIDIPPPVGWRAEPPPFCTIKVQRPLYEVLGGGLETWASPVASLRCHRSLRAMGPGSRAGRREASPARGKYNLTRIGSLIRSLVEHNPKLKNSVYNPPPFRGRGCLRSQRSLGIQFYIGFGPPPPVWVGGVESPTLKGWGLNGHV